MKKKILFVLPYFELGGTLSSIRNLLPLLNKNNYEADVYAVSNTGEGAHFLQLYANVLGHSPDEFRNDAVDGCNRQRVFKFIKSIKRLVECLGIDLSTPVFKKMAQPLTGKGYDVVIAFQEGTATRMAQYIEAPMKVAWVHSMFSRFVKLANKNDFAEVYNQYDKVVCVSKTAASDMKASGIIPDKKIYTVYNAINVPNIYSLAKEGCTLGNKLNIISVGRIDSVKRFSSIPKIAAKLKGRGLCFDWWIVGGKANAKEFESLVNNINHYNVQGQVHILGRQSNPYKYISRSDILVCLSSSETFNYTIAEAKVLGVPVVTTDFDSAFEFVENGKTGIITSIDNIDDAIYHIAVDDDLRQSIIENANANLNINDIILQQIADLLS